jgi:hypothetical protein
MLTLHSLIPVKAWVKLLLMILFRKVSAKNRYKHYHEHHFVIFRVFSIKHRVSPLAVIFDINYSL